MAHWSITHTVCLNNIQQSDDSCHGFVHRGLLQETHVKDPPQETENQHEERMEHNCCFVSLANELQFLFWCFNILFPLECFLNHQLINQIITTTLVATLVFPCILSAPYEVKTSPNGKLLMLPLSSVIPWAFRPCHMTWRSLFGGWSKLRGLCHFIFKFKSPQNYSRGSCEGFQIGMNRDLFINPRWFH